jgi:cytochrome oxidase Cu insertion factor (SCO1/SenC/PrrC family)
MKIRPAALAAIVVLVALAVGGAAAAFLLNSASSGIDTGKAMERNSGLGPGTPLSRPAPDFTLTDQFNRPVSLRSFRGKVVILAFNDPVCTTVCPLTTTAMVEAKRLLGAAGSRLQLVGVAANPRATALKWVKEYSRVHEMTNQWYFVTAPLAKLRRVWRAYGIEAALVHGLIDHTPAVYVIDPRGRLRRLYMTQMAYASVDQLGHELAQNASSLLPGHPLISSNVSSAQFEPITPAQRTELAQAGGGMLRLGPGRDARLYVFFASWLTETMPLRTRLAALNRYQALAEARGLPRLTAVDEGSVEPSPTTLPRLLHRMPHRLAYPVVTDVSGRVGDGYRVQDLPWFSLVSRSGRLLWYYDGSALGWPTLRALIAHVRAALARAS